MKESLGVELKDESLLRLALVHSSYLNENPGEFDESNERLEFLGDAVIGLVVAEALYRRRPDEPEGRLTAMRALLVRGETLARVARSLDLGPQILMGRGEAESGGRERDSNLANALEAVTGAILQDQGYEVARGFLLKAMAEELASSSMAGHDTNPKSALQELVQSMDGSLPVYRIVAASGLGPRPHLRCRSACVRETRRPRYGPSKVGGGAGGGAAGHSGSWRYPGASSVGAGRGVVTRASAATGAARDQSLEQGSAPRWDRASPRTSLMTVSSAGLFRTRTMSSAIL